MTDFVEPSEMTELRSIHSDLLDLDEGLSADNIEFLDDLCDWSGEFTEPQASYLRKLEEQLL